MTSWTPPYPLCSASQSYSFAYESTVKRWPIILTGIIDDIAKINGQLSPSPSNPTPTDDDKQKVDEGKKLIEEIGQLIYEMRHDRELSPIPDTGLPADTALYNSELSKLADQGQNKWFTAPWLFAECYMYRRVRALFSASPAWTLFDPFVGPKTSTWRSSAAGAAALATSLESLIAAGPSSDVEKRRLDFLGLAEACLWGNATDLSLLTSLSHDEIKLLQSVERGQAFLLKNDFARVWDEVRGWEGSEGGKRIDFVLDNSGFELFTDMVLADWLVSLSGGLVREVVFHPKLLPWFVSDVQPHDFTFLLSTLAPSSLSSNAFFPGESGLSDADKTALGALGERWARHVAEGRFRLSVPQELKMGETGGEAADFWTSSLAFSALPDAAPALLADLKQSDLVIFKGDLNYRKLVSDAWWPTTTPFEEALGPLAGHFPLLSLRTCKADTVCGLAEGVEERVQKEDDKWRVNGKYAVVSFVPRAADK
ncbi:hypothetical protein JCM10207_004400 [Rhodosporidiobolus poonsookiae]